MLKAATSTMKLKAKAIATRSTCSASNRVELMVFQSETTALPATARATGARISPTRSGSSTVTSIIPTVSPISSSVWASAIGMMTKAWSYS